MRQKWKAKRSELEVGKADRNNGIAGTKEYRLAVFDKVLIRLAFYLGVRDLVIERQKRDTNSAAEFVRMSPDLGGH